MSPSGFLPLVQIACQGIRIIRVEASTFDDIGSVVGGSGVVSGSMRLADMVWMS